MASPFHLPISLALPSSISFFAIVQATLMLAICRVQVEEGNSNHVLSATNPRQGLKPISLTLYLALLLPAMAGLVIFIATRLFNPLQPLLVIIVITASLVCVQFTLSPVISYMWSWVVRKTRSDVLEANSAGHGCFIVQVLKWGTSVGLVAWWAISGWWVLNNVLCMCLAITAISLLRLQSVQIAVLVMLGLLVFDFTAVRNIDEGYLLEADGQLTIAWQHADSSALSAAMLFTAPYEDMTHLRFELPIKLMVPFMTGRLEGVPNVYFLRLGMGDVVFPGCMVACLALLAGRQQGSGESNQKGSKQPLLEGGRKLHSGYATCAVIGYAVGLALASVVMQFTYKAQPALAYLVPCMLAGPLLRAFVKGEVKELWNAGKESKEDKGIQRGLQIASFVRRVGRKFGWRIERIEKDEWRVGRVSDTSQEQ